MLSNAFAGNPNAPTDLEVDEALGVPAKALWGDLLRTLAKEHSLTTQEWTSYSVKAGWSMRLKQGKRNIVYLTPSRNAFMASFALGERAMEAARTSDFPASVQEILRDARKYAEGAAVRIDVHTPQDVAIVAQLTAIKIAH